MPVRIPDTGRVFLTRMEATYALGLMDAALRREPRGVRVACYDRRARTVVDAEPGEVLHADIRVRLGRIGHDPDLLDGWTAPADLLPAGWDAPDDTGDW